AGRTLAVCDGQLDGSLPDGASAARLVIAYEPVWAIGTGLTPTTDDVAEVHGRIRERLVARFGAAGEGIRVLYGGSVKPGNARELLSVDNVDGALVGGASLKADDFRGTANVLTRTTAILAALFFATSLLLSILAGLDRKPRSILQGGPAPATQPATPGTPAPPGPGGTPGRSGVLDQLKGTEAPAPAPA